MLSFHQEVKAQITTHRSCLLSWSRVTLPSDSIYMPLGQGEGSEGPPTCTSLIGCKFAGRLLSSQRCAFVPPKVKEVRSGAALTGTGIVWLHTPPQCVTTGGDGTHVFHDSDCLSSLSVTPPWFLLRIVLILSPALSVAHPSLLEGSWQSFKDPSLWPTWHIKSGHVTEPLRNKHGDSSGRVLAHLLGARLLAEMAKRNGEAERFVQAAQTCPSLYFLLWVFGHEWNVPTKIQIRVAEKQRAERREGRKEFRARRHREGVWLKFGDGCMEHYAPLPASVTC